MRLTMKRLTAIAHDVAEEYGESLKVVGVVSSNPDANRLELLIALAGCHENNCRLMVNVGRGPEPAFSEELRSALRHAFDQHRSR